MLLTGDFLSMGLMMNFLSLKEMFLISLQGNPIFGVNLEKTQREHDPYYQNTNCKMLYSGNNFTLALPHTI